MKSIQRVVKNGSSAQVTIIRSMLFALGLKPGDFVECENTDDGVLHIRPWKNLDNAPRVSPGLLPADSPLAGR